MGSQPVASDIDFEYIGSHAVDQPTFSEKNSHLLFKGDQFIIAGKVETDENGKLTGELSMKVSAHIKGGKHQKMIKICQPHRSEVVVKSGHHVRRCTNPDSINCLPPTTPEVGAPEFMQRLLAFLKVKQGLGRGEEEEAKVIALENKFFVPPITSLIVVQPCEKDHAGHLVDPEQARNISEPASKEEEGVSEQTNPPENDLDYTGSSKNQNDGVDYHNNNKHKHNHNNNKNKNHDKNHNFNRWDYLDGSSKTNPSGWDYSGTSHNNNNNQNHNHNNRHKHNLNRWDYPDYPKNNGPCKLVLYSWNLGKGQAKAFWKSEGVLGEFEDWAWSGQAEGSCCWRLFDKPNFSGARVDLYPGKLYRLRGRASSVHKNPDCE